MKILYRLLLNSCLFFLVVILDNKDHPRYDDKFDAALNNSLAYINARVLRNTFVKLVVQKVTVDPRGIFENGE